MAHPSYFYERDLPHFHPNDAPYFVTFSLFGHFDRELKMLKQGKIKFAEYDALLDSDSSGPHHLKLPECASIVQEKLRWLAEEVLTMHAWTIMSNHVHLLMALKPVQELEELLRLVKGSTAYGCNGILGLRGKTFWQRESYDRVVRWNEHRVTFNYIVNNPVKAGIVSHWRQHPWTYVNEKLHFMPD